MSALMGPSGSGKTTCLDMLAGRKNTGEVEGEVLFDGCKPSLSFLRCRVGYVEQFDTLLPTLTVEEMLLYTSQLTRPIRESLASKRQAVEELLSKLGLQKCRSTRIGDSLHKGVSGGEAKRTNIAIQLITSPSALLLDEPTCGLDSFTSNEVMTVVKALVADGVTIVATIHSPTSYAFSLFDSLMVLLSGRVAYFGPSGQSALDYVAMMTPSAGAAPRSSGLSDADWLVDVFTRADRDGHSDAYATAYHVCPLHAEAEAMVELLGRQKLRPPSVNSRGQLVGSDSSVTLTPWWWALGVLLKYRTLRNYRTVPFLMARLPDKLIQAVVLSSLYFGAGANYSMLNLINVAAILFVWTAIPAFGAAAFCPSIVLERPMFLRERHDGLYRVSTYLLARVIEELGVLIPTSFVAALIIFFLVQFQGSFVVFWLVYLSALACGIAMAFFTAAVSPTMEIANSVLPVYVGVMWFFSGFLIRLADVPVWWRWFSYCNPLRYAFGAAMLNEFKDRDPWFVGGTLLQFYSLKGQQLWSQVTVIWGFFGAYLVLAWLAMVFIEHHRR